MSRVLTVSSSLIRRISTFMEQKIYATLDLSKSLEDFKDNVTKLLELNNVKE